MRRRRPATILAVVMAWLLFASTAFALVDFDADNNAYANGNTIEVVGKDEYTSVVREKNADDTWTEYSNNVHGRDIYGGSDGKDYTGDTNVTIGEGATVGNVYGGGKNGNVDGSTEVNIVGGTVNGDVYGGGHATGGDATVNGANSSPITGGGATANVGNDTKVNVAGGTVGGDVYGGGHAAGGDATMKGSNSGPITGGGATANVGNNTEVNISGGTVNDVYGGGHATGGDAAVNGSNSGNTKGGGATANVGNDTKVNISGGTANDVYGGGHAAGGDATMKGSNSGNITGGDVTATAKDAGITVSGGTLNGSVYAGGSADGGTASKDGSNSGNIKGGGANADIHDATLNILKGIEIDIIEKGKEVGENASAKVNHVTVNQFQIVKVITNFVVEDQPHLGLAQSVVEHIVQQDDAPVTAVPAPMPAFDGDAHYGDPDVKRNSPSDQIVYGGGDVEFTLTVSRLSKEVKVYTEFVDESGKVLQESTLTDTIVVKSGIASEPAVPGAPTFADKDHYTQKSVSPESTVPLSYSDELETKVEFRVTLAPNSITIPVRFNYTYNGTVITFDQTTVTLTYGKGDKPVTPTIAIPGGYYLLLGSVPTVTVTYDMALEIGAEGVYEVDVPLGIITGGTGGTNTPRIPLGSGGPQAAIPLGIGVPSTGDGVSMNLLLIALGAAVVAFVAVRSKRYSVK